MAQGGGSGASDTIKAAYIGGVFVVIAALIGLLGVLIQQQVIRWPDVSQTATPTMLSQAPTFTVLLSATNTSGPVLPTAPPTTLPTVQPATPTVLPALSPLPDASQTGLFSGTLTFSMQDRGGYWSIYTMSGADLTVRRLSALDSVVGNKKKPVFSPDGKSLLYTEIVDDYHSNIWITDPAGLSPHILTASGYADQYPCWSPDGKEIMFISTRESHGRGYWQLWRMDSAGHNQRKVLEYGGWCDWNSGPYPIMSSRSVDTTTLGIYQVQEAPPQAAQQQASQLANAKLLLRDSNLTDMELVAWSPNGRYIAYVLGTGLDPRREIWVYDTLDQTNQRLTKNSFADTNPVWVSDQRLLYIAEPRGPDYLDIYAIDFIKGVDTTPQKVLEGDVPIYYLNWTPH